MDAVYKPDEKWDELLLEIADSALREKVRRG